MGVLNEDALLNFWSVKQSRVFPIYFSGMDHQR